MQNLISIGQGVLAWGRRKNACFPLKAKPFLTLFSAVTLTVIEHVYYQIVITPHYGGITIGVERPKWRKRSFCLYFLKNRSQVGLRLNRWLATGYINSTQIFKSLFCNILQSTMLFTVNMRYSYILNHYFSRKAQILK